MSSDAGSPATPRPGPDALAERLEVALEATGAAAWDADLRSGTTWWSDQFFTMLGYADRPAVHPRFWEERLHPDDHHRVLSAIEDHLRGATALYDYVYRLRRQDGAYIWIEAKGRCLRDGDGRAVRYVGIMADITERMAAEAERALAKERAERALADLRTAQESLVQAETMASLGQLVAGVAHEVNTPLGIGLTAATHIGDRTRDLRARFDQGALKRSDMVDFLDGVLEASRLMVANITRAAELIQSFKRVAVDQSSGDRRRFELRSYIDEVMFSLRPRLKRTTLDVVIDCADDIVLDSYPGALSQVLTNLTINAVIHAYADGTRPGTIRICARPLSAGERADERVEVRFEDDGAGMPPDTLARVFEPFFTTRRGEGGSGLGLHIVNRTVAHLLGGTVSVASEVGRGTCFTLTLPLTAPALDGSPSTATFP